MRYDARGHGHSPGGTDSAAYLWSAQADDLLAIASAHTALPRALGGHSMGAASALLAALKCPEQTSCLILATPPTAWQTRPNQIRRYRQMQGIIEQRGLTSLISLATQNPALPDWLLQAHPEHATASRQALSGMHAPTLTAILEAACACDLPARDALHQLAVPTLILGWRD
ncbi:MAG TPA: alpha/beta hydrolase, partial [Pseudomonas sp.]|nr:alpha/beta hydrolase [Pseudomonas sp.]